jgi:hypothetical protein
MTPTFLTSALDGYEWSASFSHSFTPCERDPSTHWIEGFVGQKTGLDYREKRNISYPFRKLNPEPPAHSPLLQLLGYTKNKKFWEELIVYFPLV